MKKTLSYGLLVLLMVLGFAVADKVSADVIYGVDSFGNTSTSDVPNWDGPGTNGAANYVTDSVPRSGSDTAHHVRIREGVYIYRSVDTTGFENIVLKYFWRGDSHTGDTEGDDFLRVFWKPTASPVEDYAEISSHNLETNTWSDEVSIDLPSEANNTSIDIKFVGDTEEGVTTVEAKVDDVSVEGDILTHTVTYIAGPGGTISGTTTQEIEDTEDGSMVTAVPDLGYVFVNWSPDGSTSTSRIETTVLEDLEFTANFEEEIIDPMATSSTVTVVKLVVNDNDGTATSSDFILNITDDSELSSDFPGSEAGTVFTFTSTTTYSVTELEAPGYTSTLSESCSGTIVLGQNVTCTITNDDIDSSPEEDGGNSSGSTRSGTQTNSSSGAVLGASTDDMTCSAYITDYMWMGKQNDPAQVMLLQFYLNLTIDAKLPITGYFGPMTEQAVKNLQIKYGSEILAPWVKAGLLPNVMTPTGRVYITTKHFINSMICPSLNTPLPTLQ